MAMRRGIALVVSIALSGLASPVLADNDEIEMEPDPAPKKDPPKKDPKKDDDFFSREPQPADEPKKVEPKVEPKKIEPKVEPKKVEPKKDEPKAEAKKDEPKPEVVKDPRLAKKLLFTAQQSVMKGDYLTRIKQADNAKKEYETAHAAFLKAIELGDDPNVYYELAVLEEKLEKHVDAAIHFRTVIKATAGVRPDVLKNATKKFEDVMTKVGQLTLVVQPEGTTISLDTKEIGISPLPQPLILAPGNYKLSFAAEGYQLMDLEIKIDAGSETERGVDLQPIKIIVEPKAVVTEAPPPPAPKPPTKLPMYIGAGATGAFLVTSIITGSLAVGKQHEFSGADTPTPDREPARSSGKTLAAMTDVFLVGTLAAAGFTAYWWYFKYRPAQKKLKEGPVQGPTRGADDPLTTKVLLSPWVQSQAGGVSLGGRF